MKRFLLLLTVLGITFSGISQNRTLIPKDLRDIVIEKEHVMDIADMPVFLNTLNPTTKAGAFEQSEDHIGTTQYDLQSNTALGNRITLFDDGTIAAVWTQGIESSPSFPDRGTGYNYWDGTAWGPIPTTRIESDRGGWPSVAPFGEDGEIVVDHIAGGVGTGLLFNHRATKGTGAWTEFNFQGPAGGWETITWPRMVTSGVNNDVIHLIHTTYPVANGGQIYNGMDPALLYSRSADGGATWDPLHAQLPGTTIDFYKDISADEYTWA
ncbi:MAG: hypothetical protein JXA03_16725, partial [Bacteroidales bacterium]|nr:hypothetical protein [Bacteroidales bacterium]